MSLSVPNNSVMQPTKFEKKSSLEFFCNNCSAGQAATLTANFQSGPCTWAGQVEDANSANNFWKVQFEQKGGLFPLVEEKVAAELRINTGSPNIASDDEVKVVHICAARP